MPSLRAVLALTAVATAAACASGSQGGQSAATPAAPAAPAASAAAATAALAPDFTGDWDFTAQMRDNSVSGTWRLSRTDAGYTGVVASSLGSNVPIRSFSSRGRSFTLTFDIGNDNYSITGTAETPQTINGTLSFRGGMGRLQARRR